MAEDGGMIVADVRPISLNAILDATTNHGTVRDYLTKLLIEFWLGHADDKYGFTSMSDWRYDLYRPLRDLGLIPAWRDGYGIEYPEDGGPPDHARRYHADLLIAEAIRVLGRAS